jgi:hypothetical protein
MDNFRIDVTAKGIPALVQVLKLIEVNEHKLRVVGFRLQKGDYDTGANLGVKVQTERLILYKARPSHSKPGYTPLPAPINLDMAAAMVVSWLESESTVYGPELDHDGSNSRGWRAYNEAWGHVDEEWEAFLAVEPHWAWHGK